jgi:hypothetical protein
MVRAKIQKATEPYPKPIEAIPSGLDGAEAIEAEPTESRLTSIEVNAESHQWVAEAVHDIDSNTVSMSLPGGQHLTLREPAGKHFLEAEGWYAIADESRKSMSFFTLRLALACAVFRVKEGGEMIPKPKFEEFLDLLDEYEAMEAVGKALGFFRHPLERYFKRVAERAKQSGVDLSGT